MEINSRDIALRVLIKLDRDGTYINKAVSDVFNKYDISDVDRAFVNELVAGCVKNRYLIDYIIMQFSNIKIKKMSVAVRNILELGTYQIVFMDRVPNSAACNESVKLGKKYASRSYGFINGVLRNMCRNIDDIEFPDNHGNKIDYLSIRYSYPKWIPEKLIADYGYEFSEEILKAANRVYHPAIRRNILKPANSDEFIELLKRDGICAVPVSDIRNCYEVVGKLDISKSDTYKNGMFTLQDRSSQLASIVLDPQPNDFIIDVCAAPGGKTTHIAELMGNRGEIIAFDVYDHKINLINNAAKRLGIDIIKAKKHDAAVFLPEYTEKADRVLVDAPCSGLGVVHTKPDIKWHRNEADIDELLKLQSRILSAASRYVKRGGLLVYSTCTILKDENERQINSFLEKNSDFKLNCEKKLFTHINSGSGFYIAALNRI